MGDNVRNEFDSSESEGEMERPPTPQFRHDGGSDDEELEVEDAPAVSDVLDNEKNDGPDERDKDTSNENVSDPSEKTADEEGNEPVSITTTSVASSVDQGLSPSSSVMDDTDKGEDLGGGKNSDSIDVPVEQSADTNDDDNNMELEESKVGSSTSPDESPAKSEKTLSHGEEKSDNSRLRHHSATSAGTGTEDEDLEMPMSPIGDLGLTGMETEIVDDILKGDVNDFLPGGSKDVEQSVELHDADESDNGEEVDKKLKDEETEEKEEKEEKEEEEENEEDEEKEEDEDEEKEEEEEKEEDDHDEEREGTTPSHSSAGVQEEGSEQGEEGGDQLIADIFGASDEEEEFEGFGQADIEVTKKKKGARDQQKKSVSVMSDDEGEHKDKGDSNKTLTVPKPPEDSDSDDSGEERPVFVSDFDEMMKKKKETNRSNRRRRRDYDIISDSDDLIVSLINQMKEAAEEDKLLNGAKQAATKKLKLYSSLSRQLNKVDLQTTFLDCGVLPVLKEWLSPLPDGSLPHLKIREGLLKLLTQFPRLDTGALKLSGLGKAVMYLYRHPKETRQNKDMAGKLINEWSRPIFGVTANFKSLSREEREERDYQNMSKRRRLSSTDLEGGKTPKSIDSALQGEKKALRPGDKGFIMRARVPVPSNKEYVVRPKSSLEYSDFSRSQGSKTVLTRYDKQLRKFKDQKRNNKAQKAVGISLEGRKMAL